MANFTVSNGMKTITAACFLLLASLCQAQKYVLIDKKMALPLSYTNTVTLEHSYKNLFAVEKEKLPQFLTELEKISAMLADRSKPKPEQIDFTLGSTRFKGIKIPLTAEERMDVVLTTDCAGTKINMHLSDAKISNANNVFFINTWIKYIRGSKK